MKEKVILAYSGGLDTTAIIPWLKENFDYEVICVCADCGQEEELNGLDERAKSCGASKLYIEDLTSAMVQQVRVTIRFVLSLQLRLSLLISRLSLLGEMISGLLSHVKMRLSTADSMELIFHSQLITATAVTVTYGISATKVLSLRILPMSLTTSTCLYLATALKKLLMKANMLL